MKITALEDLSNAPIRICHHHYFHSNSSNSDFFGLLLWLSPLLAPVKSWEESGKLKEWSEEKSEDNSSPQKLYYEVEGIRFEIKEMLQKQHVLIAWFPRADEMTALLGGGRLKN